VEKAFSSSGKAEWRTYSSHFLLISWLIDWLWRFGVACVRAMTCFMTCNTISFISRLIQKCFRRKFRDLFWNVCSLNACFSIDSFWLLCCITPCKSSGRFFAPPGIYDAVCGQFIILVPLVNLLHYSRCIKTFFILGDLRVHVTQILINLGLRSFNSVLHNCKAISCLLGWTVLAALFLTFGKF